MGRPGPTNAHGAWPSDPIEKMKMNTLRFFRNLWLPDISWRVLKETLYKPEPRIALLPSATTGKPLALYRQKIRHRVDDEQVLGEDG